MVGKCTEFGIVLSALLVLSCEACGFAFRQDSVTTKPDVMTKSPTTAVLMSLAFPGLGQYYNEQYWKIPIFTGTCAVTAYLFFSNNSDFNLYSAQVDQAVAAGESASAIAQLKSKRETARDNRDVSGVIFLAGYALAAVDAYVGAHLFDFDVSDDLSLRLTPTQFRGFAMCITYQW